MNKHLRTSLVLHFLGDYVSLKRLEFREERIDVIPLSLFLTPSHNLTKESYSLSIHKIMFFT